MSDNKKYVLYVCFDPQNPIEKIYIDAINNIRSIYKFNKRQVVGALLRLYLDRINEGIKYPLFENSLITKMDAEATGGMPEGLDAIAEEKEKLKQRKAQILEEKAESSLPEPDFDIQMMDGFDSGLFGQQFSE